MAQPPPLQLHITEPASLGSYRPARCGHEGCTEDGRYRGYCIRHWREAPAQTAPATELIHTHRPLGMIPRRAQKEQEVSEATTTTAPAPTNGQTAAAQRHGGPAQKATEEQVREALKGATSTQQAAQRLGVSWDTMRSYAKRFGLELPNGNSSAASRKRTAAPVKKEPRAQQAPAPPIPAWAKPPAADPALVPDTDPFMVPPRVQPSLATLFVEMSALERIHCTLSALSSDASRARVLRHLVDATAELLDGERAAAG